MFEIGRSFVRESPIVVIDIKDIIRKKIVSYKNIFPAIIIKIGNTGAMTVTFNGNACLL